MAGSDDFARRQTIAFNPPETYDHIVIHTPNAEARPKQACDRRFHRPSKATAAGLIDAAGPGVAERRISDGDKDCRHLGRDPRRRLLVRGVGGDNCAEHLTEVGIFIGQQRRKATGPIPFTTTSIDCAMAQRSRRSGLACGSMTGWGQLLQGGRK